MSKCSECGNSNKYGHCHAGPCGCIKGEAYIPEGDRSPGQINQLLGSIKWNIEGLMKELNKELEKIAYVEEMLTKINKKQIKDGLLDDCSRRIKK